MLESLLKMLQEGGVHSPADLAGRLGVDQELLEQMLADLERLGYLRQVSGDCSSHCAGCPFEGLCVASGGRIWSLTGKGLGRQ